MKAILISLPSKGVLGGTGIVASPGGDGSFTYAPNSNYCNGPAYTTPDTFQYRIYDATTATPGATVTVSLQVTCIGDSPTAAADSYTVAEDCTTGVATTCGALYLLVSTTCGVPAGLRCNDADPDDLQIPTPSPTHLSLGSAVIVSTPSKGTIYKSTGTSPGTISTDGSFRYVPNPNVCTTAPAGVADTFTYKLVDDGAPGPAVASSAPATVSITITCQPDNPTASPDSYQVAADHPLSTKLRGLQPVLSNDGDPDLVYGDAIFMDGPTLCSPPTSGTVTSFNYGNVADPGHFVYLPAAGFTGFATFSYRVRDSTAPTPLYSPCTTVTLNIQPDKPPVAAFSAAPLSVHVGETVAFVDASYDPDIGGKVMGWSWTFGDGATGKNANPSHIYGSAGSITACLVASDEWGVESTPVCTTITVLPAAGGGSGGTGTTPTTGAPVPAPPAPPLDVDAGPTQNVAERADVTLHATAKNGTAPTYSWTQTGGPSVTLNAAGTASPTFKAPSVDTGSALLYFVVTVHDGSRSKSDGVEIVVAAGNIAPQAKVGPTTTVKAGDIVLLDGSASTDANSDPLTYRWTQWEGPKLPLDAPTSAQAHFKAPRGAATYRFALEVSDGRASNIAVQTVSVDAVPDLAAPAFSASLASDGTVTVTPDPAAPDTTLTFDFGDGSAPVSTDGAKSHSYAAAGAYTVTLTATRTDGAIKSTTKVQTIAPSTDRSRDATADAGTPILTWSIGGLLALVALLALMVWVIRKGRGKTPPTT